MLPRAAEIIAQQKQRLKDAMAAFSWDTPPFHIIPRLLAAEASRIKNSTIMTLFKSTVAGVLESFYLQGMQKALSTTTIERGSDGEPVLLEPQLEILRTADARLRELGLEPKERQEFLLAAISIWAQDAGVDPRPLLQAANVAFVTRFSTNPANDNAAKPD